MSKNSNEFKEKVHIVKYEDGNELWINESEIKVLDFERGIMKYRKVTNKGNTQSGIVNLHSPGVSDYRSIDPKSK